LFEGAGPADGALSASACCRAAVERFDRHVFRLSVGLRDGGRICWPLLPAHVRLSPRPPPWPAGVFPAHESFAIVVLQRISCALIAARSGGLIAKAAEEANNVAATVAAMTMFFIGYSRNSNDAMGQSNNGVCVLMNETDAWRCSMHRYVHVLMKWS